MAYIRVRSHNGVEADGLCRVSVVSAPAEIRLNARSVTVGLKEYYMGLKAELIAPEGESECAAALTWTSSNPSLLAVNDAGHIYGYKTGTAIITVTTHNGIKATVKITVAAAPK